MSAKEGYDVLRFIEHNRICYVSSEYVRGAPLPRWIKYHPCAEKEVLFRMIGDIAGQLSQIHRCRGNPCYRYVNPYSIIVSEEGRVSFLDINAKSNNSQLKIMQRRTVREHFLPPDEPYYQKASVELDIYGLGRTIQYLLSEVEAEPSLCRGEEAKFQKIISRCQDRHSKKIFKNVSEIQKIIPRYKQIEKHVKKENKFAKGVIKVLIISSVVCITIGGAVMVIHSFRPASETSGEKESRHSEEERTEKKGNQAAERGFAGNEKRLTKESGEGRPDDSIQKERLNMELGVVYFLKLKNYEKSKEYFEKVNENPFAAHMAALAECAAGNGAEAESLRQLLSEAETELGRQNEDEIGEKRDYYRCILRSYAFLDSEKDFNNILRLGQICLKDEEGEEAAEILGYMAYAFEGLGELNEAARMHEERLKYEEDEKEREGSYKKAAGLYVQLEDYGQAQELLRAGIKEIGHSIELRTMYITVQLGTPGIERQLCIRNIKEQLDELPELEEQEEFKKLMRQYGIHVEGDEIWQEK